MKEYTEEELWFHKKDQKIYGLMYRPKKAQKAPLIIICHGFGGSHKVNLVSADIYANAGYAVCSIDFCGGSDKTISDGSVMEMSVITEKEDLLAVVGQENSLILMREEFISGAKAREHLLQLLQPPRFRTKLQGKFFCIRH